MKPDKPILEQFERARSRLLLDHPFYANIVLRRPVIWDTATKTASMSAKGTMRINPEFLRPLTTDNVQFLLAHEAMHFLLSHFFRRGGRDGGAWNWACDAVINDLLASSGVGEPIANGVYMPGARNDTEENLYETLPKDGQGPGGIGEDLSDEDGPVDQAEAEAIKAQAMVELIQAAKQAKALGRLPGAVERMVDEIVNVRTPWHEILERYMTRMVRDDYSWQRPNRRTHHMGLYMPSKGYVPNMGEVVIAVDTSGSIGGRELAEFEGHVNRILETCRPEKVTVLYCDAAIDSTEEYTVDELPIKFTKVSGGGGTSFHPVFEYVKDNGMEPECLVYLTDGYGDQDTLQDSSVPTVWLTTGRKEFPFGDVVEFVKE